MRRLAGAPDHEQSKKHVICAHVIHGYMVMTIVGNTTEERSSTSAVDPQGNKVTTLIAVIGPNGQFASLGQTVGPTSYVPVGNFKTCVIDLISFLAALRTDPHPGVKNHPPPPSGNFRICPDCQPVKIIPRPRSLSKGS